jgi:hypothetical protein
MPRPSRGSASYRAVLALPHARQLFASAMLARLSYGLLGLPFLLSIRAGTGSYAVAGAASGLLGLIGAVLGPARARLVERRPGTLVPMAGCYAALLALTAIAGAVGIPSWLAVVLAAATGAVLPPVGPLTRTLWGVLVEDRDQRRSALSLDTVSESTVFAVGPAVSGLLIAAWSAPVALAVCAALSALGFTALAAALRRAPAPPRPDVESSAESSAESSVESSVGPERGTKRQRVRPPLRTPGFAAGLVAVAASACALAVEEIAAVAAWRCARSAGWSAGCSTAGGPGTCRSDAS